VGEPGQLGYPIIRLGEVGSTNDVARLLAESRAAEGAVVVAEIQAHGRGRLGRTWVSPPGGLWCSVLLRPPEPTGWGLLSLAVGVAVAEASEAVAPIRLGIRWPNDIMFGERKVGGVLIEGVGLALVAGIGLNVNVVRESMPEEIAARATSLHLAAGRAVDRQALLRALLLRLAYWYGRWTAGDAAVREAWTSRDVTRGTRVAVEGPGPAVSGTAEGVDADGALLVRIAGGEIRRVVAGDLIPAGPAARDG
jgi:BirA family biotin operon repressor/biotin-[acetyl-CoA-carboxylase] ligase